MPLAANIFDMPPTASIFDSECQALVNPVNCVGVAGAGLALEFKARFPQAHGDYVSIAMRGGIRIGRVVSAVQMVGDRTNDEPVGPEFLDGDLLLWQPAMKSIRIMFFPTKDNWRFNSQARYISAGLPALLAEIEKHQVESIAIPALGCGLGGLNWRKTVRPLIVKAFAGRDTRVELYGPKEAK